MKNLRFIFKLGSNLNIFFENETFQVLFRNQKLRIKFFGYLQGIHWF